MTTKTAGAFFQRMISDRRWTWGIVALTVAGAFYVGQHPSKIWFLLIAVASGVLLLLKQPHLGLLALVAAALLLRMEFSTGTEVMLNTSVLLIPVLLLFWLLHSIRGRRAGWAASRVNRPLALFLLSGLLSLLIGNALWDTAVPRSSSFWLVQIAQWAIFALSAVAFWLVANMMRDETQLRQLTWFFLLVAGGLAILSVLPFFQTIVGQYATVALTRAPFWILLAGLAAGQLLFNHELGQTPRIFLLVVLGAVLLFSLVLQREAGSNWVGVLAVIGTLVWLRFPRLRVPILILLVALSFVGVLFPALFEFAGGEKEWILSGGSRMALISRVIEVTMRNPITGLGPAAYRPYARVEPLRYGHTLWINPQVSAHNNYVDLFAHTGIIGIAIFIWFMVEVAILALRLKSRFTKGFSAGYVNGLLAVWAGIVVTMMMADWFLPFIYNIGFPGFQASVLVWSFLGGLVAIENRKPAGEVQ